MLSTFGGDSQLGRAGGNWRAGVTGYREERFVLSHKSHKYCCAFCIYQTNKHISYVVYFFAYLSDWEM